MVLVKREENDSIESEISSFEDKLNELKQKLSELTKLGKDTMIARIKITDIAPSIKMARLTYDEKDRERVKASLEDLEKELEIADKGSDFDNALKLIKGAYEDIRNGDRNSAIKKYDELTQRYKVLSGDLKHMVYIACLDIHGKISEPDDEFKGEKEVTLGKAEPEKRRKKEDEA